MNKIVVQAQLFCRYSNSAELPMVNGSATLKIGIQTGTMTVSSELSSSVIMNWECDYPLNKFKPPKDYKLAVVDKTKIGSLKEINKKIASTCQSSSLHLKRCMCG